MEERSLFSFCLCVCFFFFHSLVHRLEREIGGEREAHKRFMSFLLHLPSLFLLSPLLLRSHFLSLCLQKYEG